MNTAEKAEHDTALLEANRKFREERRRVLKAQYVAAHAHELLAFVGDPTNAERYVKDAVDLAGVLYQKLISEYPELEE